MCAGRAQASVPGLPGSRGSRESAHAAAAQARGFPAGLPGRRLHRWSSSSQNVGGDVNIMTPCNTRGL